MSSMWRREEGIAQNIGVFMYQPPTEIRNAAIRGQRLPIQRLGNVHHHQGLLEATSNESDEECIIDTTEAEPPLYTSRMLNSGVTETASNLDDFVQQLRAAIDEELDGEECNSVSSPPSSARLTSQSSTLTSSTPPSTNVELVSDPSTPCPRRNSPEHVIESDRFDIQQQNLLSQSTIPRPDWLRTRHDQGPVEWDTRASNIKTVDIIPRDLDGNSRHRWTESERVVVMVLYRWYQCSDTECSTIFNAIYPSDTPLRGNVIRAQFETRGNHEFRRSFFAVPFDDPDHLYADVRRLVENTSQSLRVKLRRRSLLNGNMHRNEGLVSETDRLAYLRGDFSRRSLHTPRSSSSPWSRRRILYIDDHEGFSDVEIGPSPTPSSESNDTVVVGRSDFNLAFRVWSEDTSYTQYDEALGFRANRYIGCVHVPDPIDPETQPDLFYNEVAGHMSKTGGASSRFISVVSSFIQLLKIAEEKGEKSKIAAIDLDRIPDRSAYRAYDVVKELRRRSLYSFRYSASAETIIHGEIPKAAILAIIDFSELKRLTPNCIVDFLKLPIFATGSVRTIVPQLRGLGHHVDPNFSYACGSISRLLGLHQEAASLRHIQELVSFLVDGWSLVVESDAEYLKFCADVYTQMLSSTIHDASDVAEAFIAGVRGGEENLLRFSGGSGQRRSRKRRRTSS